MLTAQRSAISRHIKSVHSKAVETKKYIKSLIPSNTNVTPSELAKVEEVLKAPEKIFIRYMRRPKSALMTEIIEDKVAGTETEVFSVVNGVPLAALVAFKTTDDYGKEILLVGWAKRNQAKKDTVMTPSAAAILIQQCSRIDEIVDILNSYTDSISNSKDVEVAFHKKAALRVAVLRAVSDQIIMSDNTSVCRTGAGVIIPRIIAKNLHAYMTDVSRVFKNIIADNVIIELNNVA